MIYIVKRLNYMELVELLDKEDVNIIESCKKFYKEIYISLDIVNKEDGFNKNIILNKCIKIDNIPNTLQEIGKRYNYVNKIKKYLENKNSEFIYKIKFDKDSLFEISTSIKINEL